MKITPKKQPDETACGPTCISMISDHLGAGITFEDIASASTYLKKDGLSDAELVQTLEQLGFTVKEKTNTKWHELKRANNEKAVIVVSWMLHGYIGHFSVVDEVNDMDITLADPYAGKLVTMEKITFMRLWMSYDDMWYPTKNTDITLRWMCVVRNGSAATKTRTEAPVDTRGNIKS